MKRVITVSQVVVKGKSGKPRYMKSGEGITEFRREVGDKEYLIDSVDRSFEEYGLDTSDLDKTLVKIEEEEGIINVWYRLEVDPLSLLEFLAGEGKDSGLKLTEEEDK